MKNKIYFITILLMLVGMLASNAQEFKKGEQDGEYYVVTDTVNGKISKFYYESEKAYINSKRKRLERIEDLKEKRRIYESDQRTELADKIDQINERVQNRPGYTEDMAKKDKEGTAELYAQKIDAYNEYIAAQIKFEETDLNYATVEDDKIKLFSSTAFELNIDGNNRKSAKRITTTSGLTLGFGYNFISGNDLDINDFSYSNNNYFSIGVYWLTALNERQTARFKYGIEYQTQGTELNGNRAFTINDPDNTQIERLNFNADKAKFRQDQLVFPVHLEFGGTNRKEYEDGRVRYDDYNKFKIGIGGYAGFNMSSRLKYKYELSGEDIKQTTINAFDNNVLLYGVDAYVGYEDFTLFGRMGLNDIFKDDSVNGQYAAFGVRWNW